MSVDVVYLDFVNAFDKFSHEHLIHKLQHLGVHHNILSWIGNLLNERSQVVIYNNCVSSSVEVASGVPQPQASVTGPASFVSFINDLPEIVSSRPNLYMFADDTKMYRETDKVSVTWSTTWRLLFNHLKCKVMTLGRTNEIENLIYTMNQSDSNVMNTEICNSEKDLRIIIDNELTLQNILLWFQRKQME